MPKKVSPLNPVGYAGDARCKRDLGAQASAEYFMKRFLFFICGILLMTLPVFSSQQGFAQIGVILERKIDVRRMNVLQPTPSIPPAPALPEDVPSPTPKRVFKKRIPVALPTPERLVEIVEDLGNPSFETREKAETDLKSFGPKAIDPLTRISASKRDFEPETQFRLKRVIRWLSRQRHIVQIDEIDDEGFLTSPEFTEIPGWSLFESAFDDTEFNRRVFRDLYKSEPALWFAAENPEDDLLAETIDQRCFELKSGLLTGQRLKTSPASAMSILLASCQPELRLDRNSVYTLYSLAYATTMRTEIGRTDETGKQYQKMMSHWITSCDIVMPRQRLYIAMRYKLPAGRQAARTLITSKPNARDMQYAILALAKFQNEDDIDLLAPLLNDTTLISPSSRPKDSTKRVFTCQVNDVALAALVHITKQETKPYGFPRLKTNSTYVFQQNSPGFYQEENRSKAVQQWRQWFAENRSDKPTANNETNKENEADE